jgi:polyisoprenoid-binding protein YceI
MFNMKYIVIIIISLAGTFNSLGQDVFKGTSGKARFFSDALLEDIEAETNKVTSAYNSTTGDVAVLIPIKSFSFDKSLMQEHFNENYLESDKFSEATFIGKLSDMQPLTTGEDKIANVTGHLTIHGVTRQRDVQVTLNLKLDGSLSVSGKLKIKIEDHKIEVPTLVFQNIAEEVEVTFDLKLKPRIP